MRTTMNSTAVRTDEHLPTGRAARRAEVYGVDGSRRILRPARPADVRAIAELVRPYAERRVLVAKDLISYFEDIQEFIVAEEIPGVAGPGGADGCEASATPRIVGCGALHVMWDDIAEVRTLARSSRRRGDRARFSHPARAHRAGPGDGAQAGVLHDLRGALLRRPRFRADRGHPSGCGRFSEMLRSHDDGLAEFLDLARVKPNTLGNARMLLHL